MATGEDLHSLQYNLEDTLLQCAICLEPFTNPKILPCVHTFCQSCLSRTHENDVSRGYYGNDDIQCPACRSVHRLPEGGVRELPTDHRMNLLTDLLAKHQVTEPTLAESPGKDCISCSVCKSTGQPTRPTVYCFPCMQPLCDPCIEKHDRKQSYKGHLRARIADDPSPVMCKKHQGRFVTRFCQTCALAICEICAVQDNEHHRHSDFVHRKKVNQSKDSSLLDHLATIKEALCLKKADVTSAKQNNDKLKDDCTLEIEKQSAKIALAIKRQEEVLLAFTAKYHAKVEDYISEMEIAIDKSLRTVVEIEEKIKRHIQPIPYNDHVTHAGELPLDMLISAHGIEVPNAQLKFKYNFTPRKNIVLGKLLPSPEHIFDTDVGEKNPAISSVRRHVCDVNVYPYRENDVLCHGNDVGERGSVLCYTDTLQERRSPAWAADMTRGQEVTRLNVNPRTGCVAVLVTTKGTAEGIILRHPNARPYTIQSNPKFTQKILTATDSGTVIAVTVDVVSGGCLTTLVCYSENGTYLWRKKISSDEDSSRSVPVYFLTTDSSERIVLARGEGVDVYDPQGDYLLSLPREKDRVWRSAGVCVDSDDQILVAFAEPLKVVCLFSVDGEFLKLVVSLQVEPLGICLFQQDRTLAVGSEKEGLHMHRLTK